VSGIMATMRMMKGVERVALTMLPSAVLSLAFSMMWPLLVVTRIMPRGIPANAAISADTPTI